MQEYTLEKLAKSESLRTEFFEIIDWVIKNAKEKGFTEAAISHAKSKRRIEDELNLIINY